EGPPGRLVAGGGGVRPPTLRGGTTRPPEANPRHSGGQDSRVSSRPRSRAGNRCGARRAVVSTHREVLAEGGRRSGAKRMGRFGGAGSAAPTRWGGLEGTLPPPTSTSTGVQCGDVGGAHDEDDRRVVHEH